ncbi:MAG: hypothetical protein HKN04_08720 [Rhodothermaceae bacterium]|nr:hypothetical protein [Rhodothermaceae bacterium]
MTLSNSFRSARFEFRMRVASDPRLRMLYWPVVRWGQHKIRQAGHIDPREAEVLPDTELVIDGFQGSANSYLTRAFKHAQPEPVRLAHHLHAAVGVLRAADLQIPTLVTIREPEGAALSLVSRWPYVSLAQALRSYVRYYEVIESVAASVVICPFVITTRHPNLAIEAVNERFGTSFVVFEPTEENVRTVRGLTSQKKAKAEARKRVRAQKAVELNDPEAQHWLARAQVVYARMLAYAPESLAVHVP